MANNENAASLHALQTAFLDLPAISQLTPVKLDVPAVTAPAPVPELYVTALRRIEFESATILTVLPSLIGALSETREQTARMTHDLYKHIPARLWSYVEADYEFCQGELEHVAELRDHDGFKELAKSIYSMDYDNKEAAQNILRMLTDERERIERLLQRIGITQPESSRGHRLAVGWHNLPDGGKKQIIHESMRKSGRQDYDQEAVIEWMNAGPMFDLRARRARAPPHFQHQALALRPRPAPAAAGHAYEYGQVERSLSVAFKGKSQLSSRQRVIYKM